MALAVGDRQPDNLLLHTGTSHPCTGCISRSTQDKKKKKQANTKHPRTEAARPPALFNLQSTALWYQSLWALPSKGMELKDYGGAVVWSPFLCPRVNGALFIPASEKSNSGIHPQVRKWSDGLVATYKQNSFLGIQLQGMPCWPFFKTFLKIIIIINAVTYALTFSSTCIDRQISFYELNFHCNSI